MIEFFGTAFLLGDDGLAVTAGHVANSMSLNASDDSTIAGLFVKNGKWKAIAIESAVRDDDEDVALLQMDQRQPWKSPLHLGGADVRASARYRLWGYPDGAVREMVVDGFVKFRPDLVYSKGHIRRRLTDVPLEHMAGSSFFELSATGGAGTSGSPLTIDRPGHDTWEVIGVYVGEKFSETDHFAVGYAARAEALQSLLDCERGT